MLDKSLKVKRADPADIATARLQAAAGRSREAVARDALSAHRASLSPPTVPELVRNDGFTSYVRRLERAARTGADVADPAQAGAAVAAGPALGNNTESQATFREALDEKTGEIQRLRYDPKCNELRVEIPSEFSSINARAERFAAQSTAMRLMQSEVTPRGTQWRVTGCSRRKIAAEVSILYSAEVKKAHFGGLMVCGSVWTCPPCAAKVSERRKNEVVQATDMHKSQGGGLYMVTLTCSHNRDDDLGEWLAKFSRAKVLMRQWRGYKDLKLDVGYIGDIRALEVTYGDANGWHPHEHALWLLDKPLTFRELVAMRSTMYALWRKACVKAGLPPPNRKNGVNIVVMESAAEYVAKFGREPRWGAGAEMTKQHTKVGRVKSMTPFDLLRRYHDGSSDGSHKRFGALFVQFAKCFFGKRQVIWSDGLKELFGIEQKTDEEVAVEEAEDARELVRITGEQWRVILHQKHDVRQILLERAENGGYEAVKRYIDVLMHGSDVLISS